MGYVPRPERPFPTRRQCDTTPLEICSRNRSCDISKPSNLDAGYDTSPGHMIRLGDVESVGDQENEAHVVTVPRITV